MRPYEVMIILEANVEDSTVDEVTKKTQDIVKAAKGEAGVVDRWGKRRFAYELKKRWEGYYLRIEFKLDPAGVKELDRQLSLDDNVLRHKVVRLPDHIAGKQPAYKDSESETREVANTGASE